MPTVKNGNELVAYQTVAAREFFSNRFDVKAFISRSFESPFFAVRTQCCVITRFLKGDIDILPYGELLGDQLLAFFSRKVREQVLNYFGTTRIDRRVIARGKNTYLVRLIEYRSDDAFSASALWNTLNSSTNKSTVRAMVRSVRDQYRSLRKKGVN